MNSTRSLALGYHTDNFSCRMTPSIRTRVHEGEVENVLKWSGLFDQHKDDWLAGQSVIFDVFGIAKAFLGPFDLFGCSITS